MKRCSRVLSILFATIIIAVSCGDDTTKKSNNSSDSNISDSEDSSDTDPSDENASGSENKTDSNNASGSESHDDSENTVNNDSDVPPKEEEEVDPDPESKCTEIKIGEIRSINLLEGEQDLSDFWAYEADISPQTGKVSNRPDFFRISFFGSQDIKSFILGEGNNSTLPDCTQCVQILEDVGPSGLPAGMFFQSSGKLQIENMRKGANGRMTDESKGYIENVRLDELEKNDSGKFIPKANGRCLVIKKASWNTFHGCEPNCHADGRVCGDDGCGKSCGNCSNDKTCNIEGECVPFSCSEIDLDEIKVRDLKRGIRYESEILSGGNGVPDKLIMELSYISLKMLPTTFPLDTPTNQNYVNCTQCLLAFEGSEEVPGQLFPSADKIYFQQSGSLVVSQMLPTKFGSMSQESRGQINAGTRLVESTIDPVTGISQPVQGGSCIEFKNNEFWNTISKCSPRCREFEQCDESDGLNAVCVPKEGFCNKESDCKPGTACTDNICGSPSGDNLVRNGDFEGGIENFLPKFWGGVKTSPKINESLEVVPGESGGHAVRLKRAENHYNMQTILSSKPFTMEKGIYHCSYSVKGKGEVGFSYFHNGLEPYGHLTGPIVNTQKIDSSTWIKKSGYYQIEFGVDDVFEYVFYIFATEGENQITIDNVECKKYTQ